MEPTRLRRKKRSAQHCPQTPFCRPSTNSYLNLRAGKIELTELSPQREAKHRNVNLLSHITQHWIVRYSKYMPNTFCRQGRCSSSRKHMKCAQTMSTMSRCMTFGQTIAINFRRSVFWLRERKGHALGERKIEYGLKRLARKGPFSAKEWRSSVNVTKLKMTIEDNLFKNKVVFHCIEIQKNKLLKILY